VPEPQTGSEMPADPFREGQPDWGFVAANDHSFYVAHVAAGLPDAHALELTKVYLQFMLGVMLANAGQQQENPPPQAPGDV
jgi:hypothetical protein